MSSSKPASGTSCDSTRSGDPAKVTLTPRSRRASATASAGRTWPAVPPAAITHRSFDDGSIDGDVKENPDSGEEHDEARAAVRDERERDARQRRDAQRRGEVDGRLTADECRDSRREELSEPVAAAHRYPKAENGEKRERSDHRHGADQPELLADDREDHVRVGLREVGDLPDTFAEPRTREAAGADADGGLHDLEPSALRVAPGSRKLKTRARL